jgi:enoyl-CoA hydratase/carnithine racemase
MKKIKNIKNIKFSINKEGIARIIIDDPETYNSLSTVTITSLLEIFRILNNDNISKVIIIEGGGKGFSAGHNLKEIQLLKNKTSYKNLFTLCSKLMLQITNHKKPIIAKVHGAAFAAGCQLVASCDLAYSASNAIFATPGVNIGLFCSTPMVALSRKVNRKQSMQMLLTGNSIKAPYAKEIGLINDFFSEKKLDNKVMKIANLIASKSNLVLKFGKEAFYKQLEMPLDKAYRYTSEVMVENMMTKDAEEGINAFIQKRLPMWKNK